MSMDSAAFYRLLDEADDLQAKLSKLERFLLGDSFAQLAFLDQVDLQSQLSAMRRYFDILQRRIVRHRGA